MISRFMQFGSILVIMVALVQMAPATALPVEDEDRVDIDFRRTTLVVRDIENSLALYRDVLGMKVIYDQPIRTPAGKSDDETDRIRRLVFLRANDSYVGVLGLLEYQKPRKEQPLSRLAFEPGTSVQLFATKNLEAKYQQAQKVPGVQGISPPRIVRYPSYDGEGSIPVRVSILSDPDGFVLEVNEPLINLDVVRD